MDKKQREERRRQEDIALQKGLLWVVGAIALEALLVLVNRFYINYSLSDAGIQTYITLHEVLRVLRMAAPIAAALALVWAVWQFKQKKKYALPLILAIGLAAVSVCAHVVIKYQAAGLSMLYWLVVAWAVLALVFYIYQREFFLGAAACGMSVLGLWFVRYGRSGQKEAIVLLAAIAVVIVAALWLKKSDGLLPGGDEETRFLPKQTNYTVPLVTCGASVAAVIAAMLLGSTVAYYLMFVMVAWLFALFVYYTVKLM